MDNVDQGALVAGLLAKRDAIDEQIIAQRHLIGQNCHSEADNDKSTSFGTLATSLYQRYAYSGPITALDESISLFREALNLCGELSSECNLDMADSLGTALCARYLERTAVADLEEAITWHEKTLSARTQLYLPTQVSLLGLSRALYWKAYFLTARDIAVDCLNKAVEALHNALSSPNVHPKIAFQLKFFLAQSLIALQFGTVNSESRELMLREAVIAAPAHHHEYLHVVAFWCRRLFLLEPHRQRALRIISALYSVARATHHPVEHILHHLWATITSRSAQDPQLRSDELSGALDHLRTVAEHMDVCHIFYADNLVNISAALGILFEETGRLEYLDELIARVRSWRASGRKYSPTTNNLAKALDIRYQITADESDLQEAMGLYQSCIPASGLGAGHTHYISNLARCKLALFYHHGNDPALINEAIELYELFFDTFPEKARRSSNVNGVSDYLIAALCARFALFNDALDLERSLRLADDALLNHPGDRSAPVVVYHHRAIAKRLLGVHQQNLKLLGVAIEEHNAVVNATTSTSISSCQRCGELAVTLADIWRLSRKPEDLLQCVECFTQVLNNSFAPVHERPKYGREWIAVAVEQSKPEWAMEAYDRVLHLLPRLVHLGFKFQSRVAALRPYPEIAINVSIYAIGCQNTRAAIEWLEVGRALFWRRTLLVHQTFDDIPADFAQQLQAKAQILSTISDDEVSMLRHRQVTNEFDALVDATRKLPGMENFLRPEPYEKLRDSAKDGPVVVLVGNVVHSYAVIIDQTTADARLIPLPAVTPAIFTSWKNATSIFAAHGREGAYNMQDEDRKIVRAKLRPSNDFDKVLAEVWLAIMLPIVQTLGLQKNAQIPPRIWLCPVGNFGFLPLHAAGVYSSLNPDSLLDYCVVSYVPSIQALRDSRRNATPLDVRHSRLLLVAEPDAPALPSLPNTLTETNLIAASLPSEVEVATVIGKTSIKDVTRHLSSASIVHFACHAQQDRHDPLESGFMLGDGKMTVSMLMQIKMNQASIAFLSACESATGDQELPDEAVHLAAAMLFMGFRSIVGTMWNMNDADGPKVMNQIYERLFKMGVEPTYDVVPRALHAAIRQLKNEGVPAIRWGTYIHIGI